MDRVQIENGRVSVYTIPTESAESDGTFRWTSTTMVLVELSGGSQTGLGYTYSHSAAGLVAKDLIQSFLIGQNALDTLAVWGNLVRGTRNLGRNGLGAMAVSAIDIALWDLRARIAGLPLSRFLGCVRSSVPIYGSGGFTSLSDDALSEQLGAWAAEGISRVKMKIGLGIKEDSARVRLARDAIGSNTELFVDANEAYDVPTTQVLVENIAPFGVSWLEQPVHNDDIDGMRLLRTRLPNGMALTTGEYASSADDFRRFLLNDAADILQPDVTRCQGISGFLKATALCESFHVPVSSHCAPSLHVHLGLAVPNFAHLEYFSDHVRIENMLFDSPLRLHKGHLLPDDSRPGLGLELRTKDAERYAA
jgi:L-alanine-DL-glutamate epimerase-like enolase superfamily enzyme